MCSPVGPRNVRGYAAAPLHHRYVIFVIKEICVSCLLSLI